MVEVTFGNLCCFCGENIQSSEVDPCRVTVETSAGMWQVWFCHAACFKSQIVATDVVGLSPAHF